MAIATVPPIEGMPAAVIAMVHRLRAGGLPVSTSEALDAITALTAIDIDSRIDVKTALKSTLVKDTTHEVLFERSFEAVFPRPRPPRRADGLTATSGEAGDEQLMDDLVAAMREGDLAQIDELLEEAIERYAGLDKHQQSAGHHTQRALRRMSLPTIYRKYLEAGESDDNLDRAIDAAEAGAMVESMKLRMENLVSGQLRDAAGTVSMQQLEDPEDRPLLKAGADELAAMRQAMRPLARKLATRLGNRRRRGTAGLDMRRTIRASMGTGGASRPMNTDGRSSGLLRCIPI